MGKGPLRGVRVLEFAGIGPAPFCAMLLSDMGAEVLRIDRKGRSGGGGPMEATSRGRRSAAIDLKNPEGIRACLRLVEKADILLEGFRPGVMERLGLGPEVCLERNPRLVYGRMTGWGQSGPLAHAAGHDINYIALTGALHAIGPRDGKPVPPINLLGDFGGGGVYLALGVVAALFEASRSGQGQVVDAAMTDGAASLMTLIYGLKAAGLWEDRRGVNLLDGGAHFYDTYETADGKFVALGAIEPQFYAELRRRAGLEASAFERQNDRSAWPELKRAVAEVIRRKTRDEWCALLEGTDACFAPVLSLEEAPNHPHNRARQTFVELDGAVVPNVAPRFSRTPSEIQGPPPRVGEHTKEALVDWGLSEADLAALETAGAI
jgi:alpha-methylacyl-CoA racemase